MRGAVWAIGAMLVVAAGRAYAVPSLPALMGDHMVLQRGMRAPVYGFAEPGEQVTVAMAGQVARAVADADGRWLARLRPMAAGGPYDLRISAHTGEHTLHDVMVGDVWVCSGQSNMSFAVASSRDGQKEVEAADYPSIRLFAVQRDASATPRADCGGAWMRCAPATAAGFSAVAYFFGRGLHRDLGVPIGLLQADVGGTPAESWCAKEWLAADPALRGLLKKRPEAGEYAREGHREYEQVLHRWYLKSLQQTPATTPPMPQPWPDRWTGWSATALYNAMIAPLTRHGIRGVIWYQGESNVGRAAEYRKLFPTLIRGWRGAWGQGDFPFLFVQIANFMARKPEPSESDWAALREAQTSALSVPRTAMAVAIDIGEADNIHPLNKQDVGKRLALAALETAYGRKGTVASGPASICVRASRGKLEIRFRHAEGGLKAADGGDVKGFAVAGRDGRYAWASAVIEGNRALVSSPAVPNPVSVRYAWADNPACNLANGAGLPAVPFQARLR